MIGDFITPQEVAILRPLDWPSKVTGMVANEGLGPGSPTPKYVFSILGGGIQ